MCRALRGKNKLGFINGTLPKPIDPKDPLHEAWERCNDLIVSRLHNSINPALKSSIILVDDAQQIWTEFRDRFTQQNGHRIFQLKKSLTGLQQDSDFVNVYFEKLCYMGLNDTYNVTRDQIMLMDPLPPINKISSMIQQ
ncbi:hypothetical protein F2P56_007775 [Juglans regia]|uniref:Retrotransposon Copia-like N-terminal domain-containing protein n=1 Tax=Juglans regia TaxID=51240 RepID=A0A834D4Q0_JUGRE|nr:hypothetical protein F2P56_007775 [Juglans regia]